MRKITTLFIFALCSLLLHAQNFTVPDYKFEAKSDYVLYEKDIVACIDFLQNTSPAEMANRQKENKFLFEWISGSPYAHVVISMELLPFMKTSPGMIMQYAGGCVKYSIDNIEIADKTVGVAFRDISREQHIQIAHAGLIAVTDYYTKYKETIRKDKNIEKLIKLRDKGKLLSFVERNFPG